MTEVSDNEGVRGTDVAPPVAPETLDLLVDLAAGVQRFAMYPPGHPALANVARTVQERLQQALTTRDSLTLGVAHRRLVVDEGLTDAGHPLLGDLGQRLHDHQVGAVVFDRGVSVDQVEELIGALALDVERGDAPLGLRSEGERPTWSHVHLHQTGYDRLRIDGTAAESGDAAGLDGLPPGRATELWLGLARSSLLEGDGGGDGAENGAGGGDGSGSGGGADPEAVARYIQAHRDDPEAQAKVADTLVRLTEELQSRPRGETALVRDRVSGLIDALDPETLERLMEMGGDFRRREKFVLDASQSLAVDSVIRVLESAAQASGQSISTLLLRLLKKLAGHASSGGDRSRDRAREALTDNVDRLIRGWRLGDPNPDRYTRVLDAMAEAAPSLHADADSDELPGSLRVLQMAVEVDVWGATVQDALQDLVDGRRIAPLLDLLDEAEPGNDVAGHVERLLSDTDTFGMLVREDALGPETLARLSSRLGRQAVDTLLDVLAQADSGELRRKVFDQLVSMPDLLEEALPDLLADDRWFVQRNLLVLVQRMEEWPPGFDPERYLDHPDARVRREAFLVAAGNPDLYGRALSRGLADKDERMVQMALEVAAERIAPAVVPTILNRVVRADRPTAVRVAGIRALDGAPLPMVLDALVDVCMTGRGFLGRRTLGATSPELLAALQVLASTWADDRRARRVLDTARRSKDPDVRHAAGGKDPRA